MEQASPPARLEVSGTTYTVGRATRDDVAGIVALLHDDVVAAGRESPDDLAPYLLAFDRVDADPAHLLVVVRDPEGGLAATLQLTVVPGLSRRGTTRVIVEAVRVAPARRGGGLGGALLAWAEQWALARGASLVQLTTDVRRTNAHRFYERLGYVASHVGFKKELPVGGPESS